MAVVAKLLGEILGCCLLVNQGKSNVHASSGISMSESLKLMNPDGGDISTLLVLEADRVETALNKS